MRIRLFGGVGAVTDTGVPVDVGPPKSQALLAALALSAGKAVPVWRLVELVWGEDPPRTAERTLQSYVARLRRGLGQDTIIRAGTAYRLDVPAESVDVLRFERHLDEGRLEEALVEWTGTPFAGLDTPGLDATISGLTERWLGAVELDLERRVEHDAPSTIGRLTELTAQHPFREGLWALLMTALYRAGRQADALAAYRTAREQLVEQLGVEPGPRLQELELRILSHDEPLRPEPSLTKTESSNPSGTVTFCFTDVEGASRWWAEHRAAMAEAMARHHELVKTTTERHGGHVFATGGDSVGVAFNRTGDAALWATELQAAMASEPWPDGIELKLRIGMHTGEAEEHEGGYYGPAVNLAARLAAAGHGGQTLLSATAANILGDADVRVLGSYHLDEVVGEQRISQLGTDVYPALRIEDRFQGNLPRRLGRLIGRDDELTAVRDAISAYPLVTLVGPGGIGKTRLSIAAARQAQVGGDAWLIELAEVGSPDQVARAVADTLDVSERAGEPLTRSIVKSLESRRAMLVLDNCEHVLEGAAAITDAIIRGCEHVRVLATSRERLGLNNERIISVPPLDPASTAVEMFNERAAAISPTFDPAPHRTAVMALCQRLDGIPLAIELAAARTTTLSPADLVDRLGHRLRLLNGVRRSGGERQQTLRAAIQWSYDLLTPPERALFQRLSIFTGPFDLPAAEWVAADEGADPLDIDHHLGRLVERSMVNVESGPFGRRFRLLDPIREFGAGLLETSGLTDRIAERHAKWCLCEVTGVEQQLAGWDEIEGVARLSELWPNLRSGFYWACAVGDYGLARQLLRPILAEIVLRANYEVGDWVERLLVITPPDDGELLTFGLYWAAHRYTVTQDPDAFQRLIDRYGEPDHVLMRHGRAFLTGDYKAQAELAPKAVAELRRQGEHHLAERAEINVATALLNTGRFEECDLLAGELTKRYWEKGPPTYLNWTLMLHGYSASFQEQPDRADTCFEEAIAIEVPPRTYSPNRPLEARAAFRRNNRTRAFRILSDHIQELLQADNMHAVSIACIEFVNMMTAVGRSVEAAHIATYLETSGALSGPSWRALIAESVAKLTETGRLPEAHAIGLDHRQALEYMRDVLDRIADTQSATS
jgi:predicted ATPase/DNA-binding SARP family transcriptional activator